MAIMVGCLFEWFVFAGLLWLFIVLFLLIPGFIFRLFVGVCDSVEAGFLWFVLCHCRLYYTVVCLWLCCASCVVGYLWVTVGDCILQYGCQYCDVSFR